jgi:hypothetical protein
LRPHSRTQLFATAGLVALTGVVTGFAAAGQVGPFASLGSSGYHTVATVLPGAPLRADGLFPSPTSPAAVHDVIVVTDPGRPTSLSSAPPASTPAPSDDPTAAPTPASSPSASPKPCNGDDCGGGGDH